MKFRNLALAIAVGSLIAAVPLAAQQPNVNDVNDTPGATLLMPYFQVDLSNPSGWTTVMSINNASATAVLAHVVVWSDLSVAVFAFNIYLTGYDVQAVDMRALLQGTVPQTASAGQDPGDMISPKGQFSQDINFASCSGILPPPPPSPALVTHLQNSLTGHPSAVFSGKCSSQSYGDNIARGYVTVDPVSNCTLRVPGNVGYIGNGGTGDVTNQNVLWGDFYYINANTNQARGNALIHVHASATNPLTSTSGNYTFYGRYDAWSAADNRGPLATSFATRYLQNVLYFPNGTEFVAWRDPKVDQQPFTCGTNPLWYPLGQEGILVFDEQEHPASAPLSTLPFPASTQLIAAGGSSFPLPFNRGWAFMNLNTTVAAAGPNPTADPAASQAIVVAIFNNVGHYSVGYRTIQLDSATAASHFNP